MRTLLPMLMFLIPSYSVFSQSNSFEIKYKGISPDLPSPHRDNVDGSVGINNPERGFSIRGGSFDVYSETDFPQNNYYNNINGDPLNGTTPLDDYLQLFQNDGISLVEIESYINYKDGFEDSKVSLNKDHISKATKEIPELLQENGLKAHFILNSSFKYCEKGNDGVTNLLEIDGARYRKNLEYFEEAKSIFKDINPFVAVAHLGWMDLPWDFNQYRLSGNWKKSNYSVGQNYPIGNLVNSNFYSNYHNNYRESTQRSSWGGVHHSASVWDYQSSINTLKKEILNKTLEVFEDKKVIMKSSMGIGTHIGNSMGITNPVYSVTYPTNHLRNAMSGPFFTEELPQPIKSLRDEDKFLRIGYYDGSFGGDTYSHYWTIGNGRTQLVQWSVDHNPNVGVDWAGNAYFTDVNNLRMFRGNMWMHGEMPVYETEDTLVNEKQNLKAWSTSSFNKHHQYFNNWYSNGGAENKQYDYETGEGMSSGRLQNGFYSALKLKYFNFTSFNISHNNLLDGRSPYEMPDGFDYADDTLGIGVLVDEGIPRKENTAIEGWKNTMVTKTELEKFGMPVSNNYFDGENGEEIERSTYEYIRDHLGYRLELNKSTFNIEGSSLNFETDIINRGFAAPQNKRKLYFLLLDENNNVVQYNRSDIDWRNWQPDHFSNGLEQANNLQYPLKDASYNSLDDIVIGGIPLGEHQSDWHHSPITNYDPNTYTVTGNFDLSAINPGYYKVAIILPDNNDLLKNDPNYAVRFANQATYLPCLGATILGGMNINGGGISDSDGDGIADKDDLQKYVPNFSTYSLDLLSEDADCLGSNIETAFEQPSSNDPINDIKLYPNPSNNFVNIVSRFDWEYGKILTLEGQFVIGFNKGVSQLDISDLKPGVYMMSLVSNDKNVSQRLVKN